MRLADIITCATDIVFIVFAVCGIFVFCKWRKVAKKADAMIDELREESGELEEGADK